MSATVKQLRDWLATLPSDMDGMPVMGIMDDFPHEAMRITAFRWRGKPGNGGVTINPWGTHYSDKWNNDVEFVSVLRDVSI